jgi:hypothetical protein
MICLKCKQVKIQYKVGNIIHCLNCLLEYELRDLFETNKKGN